MSFKEAQALTKRLGECELISTSGRIMSELDWDTCMRGPQPLEVCLRIRQVSRRPATDLSLQTALSPSPVVQRTPTNQSQWTIITPCGETVPLALASKSTLTLQDAQALVRRLGDFDVVSIAGKKVTEQDWNECLKGPNPFETCLRVRPVAPTRVNCHLPLTPIIPNPDGNYLEKRLRQPSCVDWNILDNSNTLNCTRRWRPGNGPCGPIPYEWEFRMKAPAAGDRPFSFAQMVIYLACPSNRIANELPVHFDSWLPDFARDLVARRELLEIVLFTDGANATQPEQILELANKTFGPIQGKTEYGIRLSVKVLHEKPWSKGMIAFAFFDMLIELPKMFPNKEYFFKIDPDTLVFPESLRHIMTVFYEKLDPRYPFLLGDALPGFTEYWPDKSSCCCNVNLDFCYPQGGSGYILTRPAAKLLGDNKDTCLGIYIPNFNYEDWAVGGCFAHMASTPLINCGCLGSCHKGESKGRQSNVPGAYATIHGRMYGSLGQLYQKLKASNWSRADWGV